MKLSKKKSLIILVCLLFLLWGWKEAVFKLDTTTSSFLVNFQLNKIKESSNIITLFIGDSSLGYAINDKDFSRISGHKTLNGALSANFGFSGSYNMLKAAHENNPGLKNVVIMNTLDMFIRPVSYRGYIRSKGSWSDLYGAEKLEAVKAMCRYIKNPKFKTNKVKIKGGYILQEGSYLPSDPVKVEGVIPEGKGLFLEKIIEFCKENSINPIYINGPYLKQDLDVSQEYIEHLNYFLSGFDIRVIDAIMPIEPRCTGNQPDHIDYSCEELYTEMYYEALKKYLVK